MLWDSSLPLNDSTILVLRDVQYNMYPLDLSTHPMKNSLSTLGSVLSLVVCKLLLQVGIPKHIYVANSVSNISIIRSNGVFRTTLVGTQFNIYTVILRALVHKDLGTLELLSILRTMSNNIWFLLSTMPF